MKLTKKIRIAKNLINGYLFSKKSPMSVELLLIYKCNSNCRYCDIKNKFNTNLTTNKWFKIIDQLKDDCININLIGGEPLLRKDIGKIINHISSLDGIYLTLSTNGKLIKNHIGSLKKVDLLLISLDGPKEVHDKIRGKGSYDKAIEGIELAKREGINIQTMTTITRYNVDHLDFIIKKADELGFYCNFQPVFDYRLANKKVNKLLPDKTDIRKAIKAILNKKGIGKKIATSNTVLRDYLKWPLLKKKKCFAGKFYFSIMPSGEIQPCWIINNKNTDILKIGLKKAIDNINLNDVINCSGCWCFNNLEYNATFNFRMKSTIDLYKILTLR